MVFRLLSLNMLFLTQIVLFWKMLLTAQNLKNGIIVWEKWVKAFYPCVLPIESSVFGYLEPVTGEKVGKSMTSKINYSDGPIEEVVVIENFLPSPKELAFREETVKVTIALSKASVEFFKQEAAKNQVSYQKMIRRLLDEYTLRHAG